jgi:outer membrane protein OmpA-like peptidoglycan-associated protein
MTSKRWMRGGLVVFMTLAQGARAQNNDPPPGAAVDPPPGPAGSSVPPSGVSSASSEAPDWGGDAAAAEEEEIGAVPEGEIIDEGEAAEEDFDARSESLAEASSLQGATGLMRVLSATSGAPGTFRFSLLTGFYNGSGFLCPQCPDSNGEGTDVRDTVDRVSANLFLSATPLSFLEAYLGIFSHSTSTNRPAAQLKQVVGDWNIGAKVFMPSEPDQIFSLGGALDLGFSTGSGQVGISGIDAINLGLKGIATADFSRGEDQLPLRAHVNLGYQFDNSGKLVEDYEKENGPIDRIERFSLDINRVDFLTFGLGVEGMFDAARPFLEWSIDIPANRQGYLCLRNETRSGDSCLRDQPTFSTTPSRLTAGVRVMPWKAVPWWLEGMSLTGALDVATGGSSNFLVEVAPEVPWSVWFGLSYAVDTRPHVKVEHVAAVAVEPPELTVHGVVVEKATTNAIADAQIRFDGRDLTGMIATAQGTFVTAALDPGRYTFRVSAPGYKESTCSVDVNAPLAPAPPAPAALSAADARGLAAAPGSAEAPPGVSSITCELEPVPKVSNINGRVGDLTTGDPIGSASVRITDVLGRELELQVDQVGAFRFENVPPGAALVSVQAAGYLTSVTRLDVEPLQELDQRFVLAPVPAKPTIRVAGQKLELHSPVAFQSGSAKLSRDAMFTIQELAPFLEEHPEIGHLEIQVHTADADPAASALSAERANTIRDALVLHGVPAARLSARGMGGSDPLKPADSPDRQANERVVFVIEPATPLPAPSPTTAAAPAPSGLPAPAPLPPPAPMPKPAPPPNL